MTLDQIEKILNDDRIKYSGFVVNGMPSIIDMSAYPDDTIWMMTEKGGWCFIPFEENAYRCHFGYTKDTSCFYALRHSRQCFKDIGNNVRLCGLVASENLTAKKFLKKLGCEQVSRESGPYKYKEINTDIEAFTWVS